MTPSVFDIAIQIHNASEYRTGSVISTSLIITCANEMKSDTAILQLVSDHKTADLNNNNK